MSLQFSEINFNEESDKKVKPNKENFKQKKRKNRTIKKKQPHENIEVNENSDNLGQYYKNPSDNHFLNNDEETDDLANFESTSKMEFPERPQITQYPPENEDENTDENFDYNPNIAPYSPENFSNNSSENNSSYYEHFVPNFSTANNSQQINGVNNELMQKLNNILHLLEEQKDNKTSNVTEELILYLFLGVFIIYTVDSFTKVGKYTR
jgi:hypothetical protein